jgi:hypothetical protein
MGLAVIEGIQAHIVLTITAIDTKTAVRQSALVEELSRGRALCGVDFSRGVVNKAIIHSKISFFVGVFVGLCWFIIPLFARLVVWGNTI